MPMLMQLIALALKIAERHQAKNPGQPPLTAEQVTAMLVTEVQAGKDRDLAWFLEHGLTPPE